MEINRQFYDGTSSNHFNDSITTLDTPTNQKISANYAKYQTEWDKSICPWKISYNSDFFKSLNWVIGAYDTNSQFNEWHSPTYQERKKGYTFYLSCNDENDYTNKWREYHIWDGVLSRTDLDLTDTTNQNIIGDKYSNNNIVINFDYSKVIALPIIYNANGAGGYITSTNINDFNSSNCSGIGVEFRYNRENNYNNFDILPMRLISLNNKFLQPSFDCTNCWENDVTNQFDNSFAIIDYNVESRDIYNRCALGLRPQNTDSYNSFYPVAGSGFSSDLRSDNPDTVGAVNTAPRKCMYCTTINDDIYSNFTTTGLQGDTDGFKRVLKSTITKDNFLTYIKEQLAYLGFRFCIYVDKVNEGINSEYFYIPIIDEKGVTNGGYYQANTQDAQTLPNYNWSNNVYTLTPYDGTDDEEDADPNIYDETLTTDLNPFAENYHSEFLNYYRLSTAGLADVINYVYTDLPTTQPENDYLTNNPIDSIVSIMCFPFLVDVDTTSGNQKIFFGKVDSGLSATFPKSHIQIIDCGQHLFYPFFGVDDFRNYTPYTSAELYLPYCGNVKIDPTIYLDKLIGIKYIVDLITGACTALIFRAEKGAQNYGLLTEMINGQIGITLPTTGIKSNDLQRDVLNKQSAYRQASNTAMISGANAALSLFSLAANPSIGGAVGALNSVLNWESATERQNIANYDVKHIQVPFSVKGSASSICALAEEPTPYLTIRYAKMLPEYNAEIYAHTIGYACIINDTISNYSGYAEITGVDLSGIVATDEEKTMIKNYLESGVYL